MENLKNELLKNIKGFEKENKKYLENEKEHKKNHDLYFDKKILYTDYINICKKEEEIKQKQSIKKALYKNNIYHIFKNIYKWDILPILTKYENKKIGEVTKNKIENEISTMLFKNYGINMWAYFRNQSDYFYNKNQYTKITLNFKTDSKIFINIKIEIERYFDDEKNEYIIRVNNESNYIENVNQQATKIYKEKIKAFKKYNELIEQSEIIKKEFNAYITGELYNINNLYMDSNNYDLKRLY